MDDNTSDKTEYVHGSGANEQEDSRGLRKKLKRERKQQERERTERFLTRTQKAKQLFLFALLVIAVGGVLWWIRSAPQQIETQDETSDLDACIQHGGVSMHIHQNLTITIKKEKVALPTNIGITASCMRPIHTHDDSGTLHLEFRKPRDVKLGEFFNVWDKQFSSSCIFEHCNGPAGTVHMRVNGTGNTEFENYVLRDGDTVEITYE